MKIEKKIWLIWAVAVMAAIVLSGCASAPQSVGPPLALQPACSALIGPIRYNSTNPRSPRHAGPALAPDLRQRNEVGRGLHCPQYTQ